MSPRRSRRLTIDGVADPPLVEVDVAEVVPVRDAQAAGLLAHRQELEHVGEAGLLEASANGHLAQLLDEADGRIGPVPHDLLADRGTDSRRTGALAAAHPRRRLVRIRARRERSSTVTRHAPRPRPPTASRFTAPMISRTLCTGLLGEVRAAAVRRRCGAGLVEEARETAARAASRSGATASAPRARPRTATAAASSSPVISRRRAVAREDELLPVAVQRVEDVKQLFLRALLAGDELHVVDAAARCRRAVARAPAIRPSLPAAPRSARRRSAARARTRRAAGRRVAASSPLPMALSRCVLPTPLGP